MKYILEIKQIVDYPRIRIYRELIQKLMTDRRLSIRGTCNLFLFLILCSYANFRTSHKRIDGVRYKIAPGEWVCSLREMTGWFRLKRQHEAVGILDVLQKKKFLTYEFLPGNKMLHYKIRNWGKFNTILEYECRCQKDIGFFFFPISLGKKLIAGETCSELDALMDLWLNTIYKDERVKGSDLGPVVYYRNMTGEAMTSCGKLAERWGRSRSTVSRTLTKLDELGHIISISFSGNQGTVLYLNNYLSTMFAITDVPVDKEEVSFSVGLRIRVEIPEAAACGNENHVSKGGFLVSKVFIDFLAGKVLEMLSAQGFSCCGCGKKTTKLCSFSDACEGFTLEVGCTRNREAIGGPHKTYRFEIRIVNSSG